MNQYPFKSLLFIVVIVICFFSAARSLLAKSRKDELFMLRQALASLESKSGGRIGISLLNTANNKRFQYRGDECFPLCSTAKLMTVSAILKRSIIDHNFLEQKIYYKAKNLVTYSPVTEKHIDDGMSIRELCEAAIIKSDNTAMNLLTNRLGGVEGVTNFARSLGDRKFRLNRLEPELNSAIPGDLRDTTSPAAMASSLYLLGIGHNLSLYSRNQLVDWLKRNTTGDSRIRAGVPKDWIVGDKTGTGDYGSTNDVAIIWPPKCSPIVLAIYFTQNEKDASAKNDVIEAATRMLINKLSLQHAE